MRTTLTVLVLAAAASAQGITSPAGMSLVEGSASFIHWGGSRRFQQVDYSNAGQPRAFVSIGWRRNGGSTGSAGTRTFDFQVDMGESNFALLSHLLDDNFIVGTRQTVFNQTVNFPDWSLAIPGPAPFDFTVSLPVPFVYLGANALVVEFSYTNNSTSGTLSTDREFNGPTTPPAGTALGTGCVATGRTGAFSHTAYMANADALPTPEYGMRLRLGGSNAPGAGSVLALIDVNNLNLGGVLCSTLYPAPTITLPLTAQASGVVPDVNLQFTYHRSLVGLTLYTQLAGVDPGQTPFPIVLSNGRSTAMGSTPIVNAHRCSYAWYTIPSTTGTATHFIGGGMVMNLQ